NASAGDGVGFLVTREEYRAFAAVLAPLWGTLFLIAATADWLIPHFLALGAVEIPLVYALLALALAVYTLWSVAHLAPLPGFAAAGVFALSWITLPIFYLSTRSLLAFAGLALACLACLAMPLLRRLRARRAAARLLNQRAHRLAAHPDEAALHEELGRVH